MLHKFCMIFHSKLNLVNEWALVSVVHAFPVTHHLTAADSWTYRLWEE
jgi:hypothetical protein